MCRLSKGHYYHAGCLYFQFRYFVLLLDIRHDYKYNLSFPYAILLLTNTSNMLNISPAI